MNKSFKQTLLSIIAFACLTTNVLASLDIKVTDLRCEYLRNPLGIDVTKPRLSWKLRSAERGQKQTAYHVLITSSRDKLNKNIGDLWDSGKVKSDQSIHVAYNGKQLESRTQCFWKVKVWDKDGKMSNWSDPGEWSIGLLKKSDWKAKWIGGGITILDISILKWHKLHCLNNNPFSYREFKYIIT